MVITEQEMHKLSKLGHNSEDVRTFECREKSHKYVICTTQCPAYVNSSQQGNEKNEEPVYSSV